MAELRPASLTHCWPALCLRGGPPFPCNYQKVTQWQLLAAAGSSLTGRSASPRSHPPQTSQYLIWIQDASNPVLSATHFHTHYISLSLLCVLTLHSRQRNRCRGCLACFPFSQSRVTSPESVYVCRAEDHFLGARSCAFFWLLQTQSTICSKIVLCRTDAGGAGAL